MFYLQKHYLNDWSWKMDPKVKKSILSLSEILLPEICLQQIFELDVESSKWENISIVNNVNSMFLTSKMNCTIKIISNSIYARKQ